jgi:serine/threonine-protein kinase
LIHDQLLASPEAADRFRREARAAAAFSHPNIVVVHDFGVTEGARAFLVMELLQGISLREEIRRDGRLSVERTKAILRGVCSAVDAAHRRQLVHRDLKPENIFLVRSEGGEIPKVLDFGLAKYLQSARTGALETETMVHTETGILVGTLQYMAPEQLLGESPHASWDLWALAVVAYEMLTGIHPFRGASRTELHRAVLAGAFIPIEESLPQAPAEVRAFFARALSVDAHSRPRDARQFFEQFEASFGRV